MKRFSIPEMDLADEVTFLDITEEEYSDLMCDLNETLNYKMRQNDLQEAISIEYASKFVTTV